VSALLRNTVFLTVIRSLLATPEEFASIDGEDECIQEATVRKSPGIFQDVARQLCPG
jgi:hypothetical protein